MRQANHPNSDIFSLVNPIDANAARNQPVLQKRQAVAPISDPQEKMQVRNFLGILGRLLARISA